MKRKSYKILKWIPIVGIIVRNMTTLPELYGSNERSDGFGENVIEPFIKYLEQNPDIQPTRALFYEWMKNKRLKEGRIQNE